MAVKKNNVEEIDFKDGCLFQVDKFLRENGYVPVDSTYGWTRRVPTEDDHSLGVAFLEKNVSHEPFLIFLTKPVKRNVIFGCFWFDNEVRGATNKNWVFEVFGRKNKQLAIDLANRLSKKLKVKIKVVLENENEYLEVFASEINPY